MSLETRMYLLEAENAALRAENDQLKHIIMRIADGVSVREVELDAVTNCEVLLYGKRYRIASGDTFKILMANK